MKTLHPCPDGYRKMKRNEIVREGDLMNAHRNTFPFIGVGQNGYISASMFAGKKLTDFHTDKLAFYRKVEGGLSSERPKHPCPKGWRLMRAGEKVRKGDLMNAKSNPEAFERPDHGFCDADCFIGDKLSKEMYLAFYRKLDKK